MTSVRHCSNCHNPHNPSRYSLRIAGSNALVLMLLIIGDPKGTHSMTALDRGYDPEDIWVWENDSRHIYTIKMIRDKINVTTDLQELVRKAWILML